MRKLNILIAGSTGYIGVQLIRLLIKHKNVNIKYLCGNTSVGKKISSYDKSLTTKNLPNIVKFNKKYLKNIDVIFHTGAVTQVLLALKDPEYTYKNNIEGTINFLEIILLETQAAKTKGKPVISVHISDKSYIYLY